jgi:ABC-type maltose transport system permease subunit
MAVGQKLRKGLLVLHISVSAGWIGAVLAFLAVAAGARHGATPETAQAGEAVLELIGWTVLVPLSLASLATGIIQSLVTPWGLFRHYWVLAKLLITVVATAVLLVFMQSFGHGEAETGGGLHGSMQGSSSVLHASGGLVLLVLAVLLSVYKPRGLTAWGLRQAQP